VPTSSLADARIAATQLVSVRSTVEARAEGPAVAATFGSRAAVPGEDHVEDRFSTSGET